MGHQLLSKMGWEEGRGLGRDGKGPTEPVSVVLLGINDSARAWVDAGKNFDCTKCSHAEIVPESEGRCGGDQD